MDRATDTSVLKYNLSSIKFEYILKLNNMHFIINKQIDQKYNCIDILQ